MQKILIEYLISLRIQKIMDMKRVSLIILLTFSVLIVACKKNTELKIYDLEIVNEKIVKTNTSAKITVKYSYPTKLKSVDVILSMNADFVDATTKHASVKNDEFSVEFIGLQPGTKYYYRYSYYNGVDIVDMEVKNFETLSVYSPTVITFSVTGIAPTSAKCGGEVTYDGGAPVTAKGVCWSTSQDPTTTSSHTNFGNGTGSFISSITGLSQNTTYYVRAYAANREGTSYGEQVSFTTLAGGGTGVYEYVDLGLPSGLLWGTCNVGADSPGDNGGYFAWGETKTKSCYDWSTYKWCLWYASSLTKYNTDPDHGYVDNITTLEPADDVAHVKWGCGWRMPTADEIRELKDNCTFTWTTQEGKTGFRVTGINGNSIFLPDDGCGYGSTSSYWSSSLYSKDTECAYELFLYSGHGSIGLSGRMCGHSVRPVCPSQ